MVVGPGRYPEGNITPLGNGRRSELVRFVADRDGSQTGDPPGEVLVDATGFEVGFRIASRPWVVVSGFSVTGATEEGIAVKSSSDHSVVANCMIFSNRGRGVWVRDSRGVVVFNSLIYANGGSGIDFGGESRGSAGGVALGNTIFANGLDGIRLEGLVPSPRANAPAERHRAESRARHQPEVALGERLRRPVEPEHRRLRFRGHPGRLRPHGNPLAARPLRRRPGPRSGRPPRRRLPAAPARRPGRRSRASRSTAARSRRPGFSSTARRRRVGAHADVGRADLGFHYGGKADFLSGFGGRVEGRIKKLRGRATQCERLGISARIGRVQCVAKAAVFSRLERLCALQSVGLCQ